VDITPSTQLKLEQTLSQWGHWQCEPPLAEAPDVIAVLTEGISNHSVLVKSGTRHLVVRVDGQSPSTQGLNRHSEWRVLHTAAEASIAPAPRYFNPDLGSLVCDYLEPDPTRSTAMTEVAALLRAIHKLPRSHQRLNLPERIGRLEKTLEHSGGVQLEQISTRREKIQTVIDDIGHKPGILTLCHNDLLRANRISNGNKLWAIDWEYCAMGSPWFDLAVVIHGDELSEEERQGLLDAYLGRPMAPDELAMLYRYGVIYSYLEILWYQAFGGDSLATEVLERKQTALITLIDADCL
jgi:thiamine kinase